MMRTPQATVTLSCHAPSALTVAVAGTFNHWNPEAAPLQKNLQTGMWYGMFELLPGHHEYKFVVDGHWCCDPGCEHTSPGCPRCVINAFGTMNRVLKVT